MAEIDRIVERLVERDTICAAILALAATLKTSKSLSCDEWDLLEDDICTSNAYIQLVQLLEDPQLAGAIAHAFQLWVWQNTPNGPSERAASPSINHARLPKVTPRLWLVPILHWRRQIRQRLTKVPHTERV